MAIKKPTPFLPPITIPKGIQNAGKCIMYLGYRDQDMVNAKRVKLSRAILSRRFHAYLELGYQSKHDNNARIYCISNKITSRNSDGSQIKIKGNQSPKDWLYYFYSIRADTAIDMTISHILSSWKKQTSNNGSVFKTESLVSVCKQNTPQGDGYCYETSYFYTKSEFHVQFHCYPPR